MSAAINGTMIIVLAPNDSKIDELVEKWTKRHYDVASFILGKLDDVSSDIEKEINKYELVTVLFIESAFGNIPQASRWELLDRIYANRRIKKIAISKKRPRKPAVQVH